MKEIFPLQTPITFSIEVPGSKSITNRIFLLAAFTDGDVSIQNALLSDDTIYMMEALKKMGIFIDKKNETHFVVHGKGGKFEEGDTELFLGNAGTATRFLTAASPLRKGKTIITGNKRMCERPILELIHGLKNLGVDIKSVNGNGCPPLEIAGGGHLEGGTITIKGTDSSQYFSALLMSAPLAKDKTIIIVDGDLVSKPYIDITIDCQKHFGVYVENQNYKKFIITPQVYKAIEYVVEGDASSASYFFALAALTKSSVTVTNIPYSSAQGDIHFVDVLKKMGCSVQKNNNQSVTVTGPKQLQALDAINMNDMPDVAMTLAILAAAANGKTKITGIQNLRIKETDRITALATELKKIGIVAKEGEDYLEVLGGATHGGEIDTYDDHRMAMCFAILGTKIPGIKIKNPECVSKTYPNFWEDLKKVGVKIQNI